MKTTVLMAITADGKIAKTSDQLADWTSKADKKMFVAKTREAGVIVMGLKTYQTIGKPLPGRLNLIMAFPQEFGETIAGQLEYTDAKPEQILHDLSQRGFTEVIIGGGATINGMFLLVGLVDELWLTIEPKLFGAGLNLFGEIDVNLNLELIADPERIGDNSILVKYKINY